MSLPASALPPGFQDTVVFTNHGQPIDFDWDPNGGLWVGMKAGQVWRKAGTTYTLTLTLVVDNVGDSGLGSIRVDPDYATNRHVWVYYTSPSPSTNRLSRFEHVGDALVNETVMVQDPNISSGYNGGCIRFFDDGTLLLTTGFDGDQNSTRDLHTLKGKVLRINRDGSIPPDNPYADGVAGDPRVWASGLRNPFRCAVQPGTERLWVGDVGQVAWEEINVVEAEGNYGWPDIEGPEPPNQVGFRYPVYAYPHPTPPPGSAVIGGDFAEPGEFPAEYEGDFFYSDWNQGKIYRMRLDANSNVVLVEEWADDTRGPLGMTFGPDGALYYSSYRFDADEIHRIQYVGGPGTGGAASNLRVRKAAGGDITLVWNASCQLSDTDYAVYEGAIPAFTDWEFETCSTGGDTLWTFTPDAGSRFYLVVPHQGASHGSYGRTSAGLERLPASQACFPQVMTSCS
jgi:glucose/arabinose dehydrogenase